MTGKVKFGVVGGGFAYRADILAWSRRPVRTKLNVGVGGSCVVTDGTPEKGRRYSTFTYTERASVAIFNLSDYIN